MEHISIKVETLENLITAVIDLATATLRVSCGDGGGKVTNFSIGPGLIDIEAIVKAVNKAIADGHC